MRRLAFVVLLCWASLVQAQGAPPPKGPAEIINQAREAKSVDSAVLAFMERVF